jgi:hypothetical protein
MTNVIEPFDFEPWQFARLAPDEEREVKRLVYMRRFQETIVALRERYGITSPTHAVALDELDLENVKPVQLRHDLIRLLKALDHQPRKWLLFCFIYARYGRITRPYKSHPSFRKLPDIRRFAAMKKLPLLPDEQKIPVSVPEQFVHWFGEPVDNNSTVAVRGGAKHAAMFLTADATREHAEAMLESAMQYLDTIPRRKKGQRSRGPEYDQLYDVAKLYRKGFKRPLDIQTELLARHFAGLRKEGWKLRDDSPEAERQEQDFRDVNTEAAIAKRIAVARKQGFL